MKQQLSTVFSLSFHYYQPILFWFYELSSDMNILGFFFKIFRFTRVKFKGFLSFMIWLNVNFQTSFLSESGHTHVTFKGLLSFMNSCNLPFWLNLESHMSHLNGLSPSWIDVMWTFTFPFCVNFDWHISHSKGFFFHELMQCDLLTFF